MTIRRKTCVLAAVFGTAVAAQLLTVWLLETRLQNAVNDFQLAAELRSGALIQKVYAEEIHKVYVERDEKAVDEISRLISTSFQELDGILETLSPRNPLSPPHLQLEMLGKWADFRAAALALAQGHRISENAEFMQVYAVEMDNYLRDLVAAGARKLSAESTLISWLTAFTALLTVLVLGAGLWLFFREIMQPLELINDRLRVVIAGNSSPAQVRIPYTAENELGTLSRQFNSFMEKMQSTDQEKDRFLANMSHEIRTPLNGIIGFLENLNETELNEQQRQYLRVINSSSRALLRVINDILDMSKLTAGKMELESVAFDLKSLVDEQVAVAKQLVKGKPVKVGLRLAQRPDYIVRGDPSRLRQVLGNLLSNAVKFTDKGEIFLKVDIQPTENEKLQLDFAVSDTGIGMLPEQQKNLFSAFFQAENNISRKRGGTGLGLCISSNLVKLMGGEIQVQSAPAGGSTFSFSISSAAAPPEEQVRLSSHFDIKLSPKQLKHHLVMAVDDNPTNLYLLETIFQKIGLPYLTAVNGQEALEKAAEHKLDLIFMDIQMPVMDGYTAIREIRKLENCAATQIIALTASAMQGDVEKALGVGSTGFLAKPFERNQLLLCIAEQLGVPFEQELRPLPDLEETEEELAVRQMHDFMRQNYQAEIGEIKLILAQAVDNWRPRLEDLVVFGKKENWDAVRAILHSLKGQLGAIGLPMFATAADELGSRIKSGNVDGLKEKLADYVSKLGAIFKIVEKETSAAKKSLQIL